jgi:4-alpha-glucanotransferase
MRFPRSAGVLVHPTSFPGRYGIGDLGDEAYAFVDWLVSGKQGLWQVLPLGPTGYGDSPYQSFSAFAGNPLLISPDRLVRDGFLPKDALDDVPAFPAERVDYGPVIACKNALLRRAFVHFQSRGTSAQRQAFAEFCVVQNDWLWDFAHFMALKAHHVGRQGGVWNSWPSEIAFRQSSGLARWSEKLANEVDYHKFQQFLFFQQWFELKEYANRHGVRIVGDAPIFVAFDSADVWANQNLFFLDAEGSPTVVAGVPPDYFSPTGQRWGNPLYRWERMAADDYKWWEARLRMVLSQVDVVRLDHFRGFEGYWEIPAAESTAVVGRWIKGPGPAFFAAMVRKLGQLPLIAEDLGVITPEVEAMRDGFDLPGMRILQFAFGGERNSSFLPHNFVPNTVVYTGTHDNDTTIGWWASASLDERDHLRRYLGRDVDDVAWDLVRLAYASVADKAIATLQDLLRLGTDARMNYPSRPSGNWQWRFLPGMLTDTIAHWLACVTELYGRHRPNDPER